MLAGGQSSRMGQDKALLPWKGATLVQSVAQEVLQAAGSVTLIGTPEVYGNLGFPVIPDLIAGCGPLGGLHAALSATSAEWNLVVACDMPSVTHELLEELLAAAEQSGADALVPETPDGLEPLCAVYHARLLPAVESAIQSKLLTMHDFVSTIRARLWPAPDASVFRNMNTPEQLLEGRPKDTSSHYIEFVDVYKTFDKPVLVDVSFHVDAGETVAIIGRSGVGKSVTLGHIMGFLKPDQGRIYVAYSDITDMTETELRRIRKKVTMVFQSGALFDSLTVGENILFSLETREDYNEQNKEDVVRGLLNLVDMADYENVYPTELSTGHKRAVAIARALAAQPECILYDEPTTMVDPIMSDHLIGLMLRLKNQLRLTAVVVTHDLDLMRRVADTVVVLYEGKAIFFGPVADLEKSPHPHIQEFLAMDRVA
ncbi:MAG: transporter related [Bryobacterales bacterium]|nr:transporter related [Bryobacterales bacterium]